MKSKLFPVFAAFYLFVPGLAPSLRASTVTVNTQADTLGGEDCSLRAAIQTVNGGTQVDGCVPSDVSAPDTIALPAGDYVLELTGTDEDNCGDGDLDVNANLTLNGAGAGSTSISASGLQESGPERVLDINPFGAPNLSVVLNGVTIRDGMDFIGGGILIQGDQPDFLTFGKAGEFGSSVDVTLNDVVVTLNDADLFGGGIANNGADLTLNNTQVTQNEVRFAAGGGIGHEGICFECVNLELLVVSGGGLLTLQNSTVSGNTSGGSGGGIFNQSELVMDSSAVSGNTASGDGGGIFSVGGSLSLITNSTIDGNRALGQIENTLRFPDLKLGVIGDSGFGGGIFLVGPGEMALVNTTISGNSAFDSGGGLAVVSTLVNGVPLSLAKLGSTSNTTVGLFNVTIANNTAEATVGGGVFLFEEAPVVSDLKAGNFGLQTMVANTLIADNFADEAGPDCFGNFTSLGYNLIGQIDENCVGFGGTGDQSNVPALLGPLQNNGGPTMTHALLQGSPAIDRANPDGCLDEDGLPLSRDQRNFLRPVNATGLATAVCDIGAYEVGGAVLRVVKTDSTQGQSVAVGGQFTYTITVTNDGPNDALDVQLSDPLPAQVAFVGPITTTQGTCGNAGNTVNCDLDDIPVGATATISFPVEAVAAGASVVNTVTVTTSTKDFESGGTFTATVATAIGGGVLIEGGGCQLRPAPAGSAAPIALLLPFLAGAGLWLRTRRG